MTKHGFSEPQLKTCKGDVSREWYVSFHHSCSLCDIRKVYQLRMGINYLKTAAERHIEGAAIVNMLKEHLTAGWNPHHQRIEDFVNQHTGANPFALTNDMGSQPFNKALIFALEQKKPNLALKSYQCFSSALKFALRAATNLRMDHMLIRECRKPHIKELLAQMVRDRQADYDAIGKGQKVTGNFYNKYKCYLLCIFSELEEYEAVEYNPCANIKDRPQIKTNIHRHATQQERDIIKAELQKNHVDLYNFMSTLYYTGIRPGEIFGIRIGNINLQEGIISLNAAEGGSKTRESRRVPIPDAFMEDLKKLNLERYNPRWYLFSKKFQPGEKRLQGFYASKEWAKVVHDGLGLNVSLYCWKGMGGDDKREAGISLQAVSSQYGHRKLSTTMIYTHGEQARMDEELRKKTRAL